MSPAPTGLLEPGRRLPALHRGVLAIVFLVLALLGARQIGSVDVGFHLKAGDHILSGRGWPDTDPFTYTINDHPYIDTTWGYQVILSLIHRGLGAPGIVLFHMAVALAVFAVLYRTARLAPVEPVWLGALAALGVVACEMRFEARPELVSWLMLVLTLHILHRRAEGLSAPPAALAAIHLVWANLHALFVLGWVAIACFVVGTWLARRRLDATLARWGAASVAVTLVNPYGWRGALFPFTLATRLRGENLFGQSIGEFVSPFDLGLSSQYPFYPRAPIAAFWLLTLLALAACVGSIAARRYWRALLIVPFGILASLMIRNIPLLVLAGLAPIAWVLPGLGRARGRTARILGTWAPGVTAAALVVLGLRVYHDAYYVASRRTDRTGLGWNRLALPVDAARYADRAALTGPMLNHLNFGGYLMWARPQPVFIDGRLEVTGEEFYRDYREALADPARLEACVSRYGIEWIVFPYAAAPGLLGRLSRDPRWRLAYVDHLAAIFVRAGPDSGRFIDPALAAGSGPTGGGMESGDAPLPGLDGAPRRTGLSRWARGLIRREEYPFEPFQRGLFHLFRGELSRAESSFGAAARACDGAWYEIYSDLGAVYHRQGRPARAAQCYRIVLQDDPGNEVARRRLSGAPGIDSPEEGR